MAADGEVMFQPGTLEDGAIGGALTALPPASAPIFVPSMAALAGTSASTRALTSASNSAFAFPPALALGESPASILAGSALAFLPFIAPATAGLGAPGRAYIDSSAGAGSAADVMFQPGTLEDGAIGGALIAPTRLSLPLPSLNLLHRLVWSLYSPPYEGKKIFEDWRRDLACRHSTMSAQARQCSALPTVSEVMLDVQAQLCRV